MTIFKYFKEGLGLDSISPDLEAKSGKYREASFSSLSLVNCKMGGIVLTS